MTPTNTRRAAALLALAFLTSSPTLADVKLPSVLASNMVLQQSTFAPIWGWADPREEVTVSASWLPDPLRATADAAGKWMVRLKTPDAAAAAGAQTITIKAKNSITLQNVAIGEVWLASGQSNMEFPLAGAHNAAAELPAATDADIRYFAAANEIAAGPRGDCTPQFPGGWRCISPATAPDCTAVGYFFAKQLRATLKVPVGILQSDWGGTPVEAWTGGHTLAALGEYRDFLKALHDIDPNPATRDRKLAEQAEAWWNRVDQHPHAPGADWNKPSFSDSAWHETAVPATWSGELANFDGFVYFRRTVDIPADKAGKPATLNLGPIDDRDDAYINGTRIGATHGQWQFAAPRSYEVPAGVTQAGPNVLAVRVRDDQGAGGINGAPAALSLRIENTDLPLAGTWKYAIGPSAADLPIPAPVGGLNAGSPTVLYNAMIHPLRLYAIRGALWYQGESNRGRAEQYEKIFPAMIRSWRDEWAIGDFPFYFVQIAPFNYGNDPGLTAEIRDVQTRTLSLVPNTGMACTMDIGDPKDIHPTNKADVGRRLAGLALAETYGHKDIVCNGPMYDSMTIDGDSIVIKFDLEHSKGLTTHNGVPTHFQIAGEDHIFYRAQATIETPDTIRVRRDGLKNPAAVRYGWEGACEPNLFNSEGLPAVPFRTDNWDRPKDGWPDPRQ